jgi:hypothetical protein
MAIDTEQKKLSAIMHMMPFRGPGVLPAELLSKVGTQQAAVLLYSGVTALTYGRGVQAPYLRNAVVAPET